VTSASGSAPPAKGKGVGFTTVSVAAAEGGHAVQLDGKPLRTPQGIAFVLPSAALARAIAAEWQASAPRPPAPDKMPLTRIAGTALDRTTQQRATIEDQLLGYAETELLCYRAEAPEPLVERQHQAWQPLLDWLAIRHDALLVTTTAILPVSQPEPSLTALRGALSGLDPWRLAALSLAVGASGSLVIGLALLDSRLDPEAAFELAELDASFQIERWGEDSEATARRAGVRADLELARRFLDLLTD